MKSVETSIISIILSFQTGRHFFCNSNCNCNGVAAFCQGFHRSLPRRAVPARARARATAETADEESPESDSEQTQRARFGHGGEGSESDKAAVIVVDRPGVATPLVISPLPLSFENLPSPPRAPV